MDYAILSSKNMTMLVSNNEPNHENLDSNQEQEVPLFGQFPSPFFDDILYNQHQHTTSSTVNEPTPLPAKTKRVRKKRSVGKNDRHSKIHTAQGLRDRRMRLSVHIARKFFGLQDMLGFDKASKTIEWLFCMSKKAIDELTESTKTQNTPQSACKEHMEIFSCESKFSDCELDSGIEFDATSKKGKQLKLYDEINPKNTSENDLLAKELMGIAKSRAKERMMINNLDESKHMFGANPNYDDVYKLQLGFFTNPNNLYIQDSSSSLLDYVGTAAASSSTYLANHPLGWLDSSNTCSNFLGGWDAGNLIGNYGLFPNLAPSTGDANGQNFGPVHIPPSSFVHFQNQTKVLNKILDEQ